MKKIILCTVTVLMSFVSVLAVASGVQTRMLPESTFYVDADNPANFSVTGLQQNSYRLDCLLHRLTKITLENPPVHISIYVNGRTIEQDVIIPVSVPQKEVSYRGLVPVSSKRSIDYKITAERAWGNCRLSQDVS